MKISPLCIMSSCTETYVFLGILSFILSLQLLVLLQCQSHVLYPQLLLHQPLIHFIYIPSTFFNAAAFNCSELYTQTPLSTLNIYVCIDCSLVFLLGLARWASSVWFCYVGSCWDCVL